MGDAVDKVVALAGVSHVEGHKRTTKSGKIVNVDAYTRVLRSMSMSELRAEMGKTTDRTKQAQILNETRRRVQAGEVDKPAAPKSDGTQNRKGALVDGDAPKKGGALDKWYAAYSTAKVDTFGKAEAKTLSDGELDEAITELEDRIANRRLGMSGRTDLNSLKQEKESRASGGSQKAEAPKPLSSSDKELLSAVSAMLESQSKPLRPGGKARKPKGAQLGDVAFKLGKKPDAVKTMLQSAVKAGLIEERANNRYFLKG